MKGPPPAYRSGQVGALLGIWMSLLGPPLARAEEPTQIDLSDDWVPRILQDGPGPQPNRHRRVYIALANDQIDEDGQPLQPGEANYLELYGILPSLSVLAERYRQDTLRDCQAEVDFARLAQLRPSSLRLGSADRDLLRQRLACEGLLPLPRRERSEDPIAAALRRFQRKHMIAEGALLGPETVAALSRGLLVNDVLALRRVLRERTAAATGVIEDGSAGTPAGPPRYRDERGTQHTVRNLVDEYADAALAQLGLSSPESTRRFFLRHGEFSRLMVPVRLPPRPAYYAERMELSVTIDRGDIYYDLPFDQEGRPVSFPRQVLPSLSLQVRYLGQEIPLLRWPTTIGGWRAELGSDGQRYLRYKNSDVGPRVLREIVAAPVWLAPETTPGGVELRQRLDQPPPHELASPSEIGPGHRSAYGLVNGALVSPRPGQPDDDNGIRIHGSPDFRSVPVGGASHGCHRLLNQSAVRLFSFILAHRAFQTLGQQPLWPGRRWPRAARHGEWAGPSRGFVYQLDPPMPVRVLEGRVRGTVKSPITQLIRKPGAATLAARGGDHVEESQAPRPPEPGERSRNGPL